MTLHPAFIFLGGLVVIICLPVFRSGQLVSRSEGGFSVALYLAYLGTLLFLRA